MNLFLCFVVWPSSLSRRKVSEGLPVSREIACCCTNLKEACSSWRRVNGLFSCVGVFCGVPGPLPEPLFFSTLFSGTAWNLGSFAGISSTLDVSMAGSGCDILGTYMLSSSSTSKSSSSSVIGGGKIIVGCVFSKLKDWVFHVLLLSILKKDKSLDRLFLKRKKGICLRRIQKHIESFIIEIEILKYFGYCFIYTNREKCHIKVWLWVKFWIMLK